MQQFRNNSLNLKITLESKQTLKYWLSFIQNSLLPRCTIKKGTSLTICCREMSKTNQTIGFPSKESTVLSTGKEERIIVTSLCYYSKPAKRMLKLLFHKPKGCLLSRQFQRSYPEKMYLYIKANHF